MKNLPFLIFALLFGFSACGDDDNDTDTPSASAVNISGNQEVSLDGDLEGGVVYEDLSWAQNPNVACWVSNAYFSGRHLFYTVEIPQGQRLTVRLMPNDSIDINLYGYVDYSNLPPLDNVITCEASPSSSPSFNPPGGGEEVVVFGQAINQGFTALIGVAGAEGVLQGSYNITFTLEDF